MSLRSAMSLLNVFLSFTQECKECHCKICCDCRMETICFANFTIFSFYL